jgi:hypothetical protein
VSVIQDDVPEAVVSHTGADGRNVVDERMRVDVDRAGKVHVVLVERVGHSLHDEGPGIDLFDCAAGNGSGRQVVGGQGQVRPVLFGRTDREHNHGIGRGEVT